MPVERSATGHVFLAWQQGGAALNLAPSKQAAQRAAKLTLETGSAEIGGDFVPGLNAVAVPVLNGNHDLVAVITAVSAGDTLTSRQREQLCSAGQAASSALGWQFTEKGN